ncbi:hypothetical protein GJ496_000478, partial [Pomphorhynchus laevis]
QPTLLDECNLDDKSKSVLLENIRRRLTPQPVKCRADIEVACYAFEGIDAIRDSLKAGLALSTEEIPVKISLIAPPLFVVTLVALDRKVGIKQLESVIDVIRKTITEKYKGIFKISLAPKVVTDYDDSDLKRRLEEAEAELREVPGDDEGEEKSNEDSSDDDSDEEDDSNEDDAGDGEATSADVADVTTNGQ